MHRLDWAKGLVRAGLRWARLILLAVLIGALLGWGFGTVWRIVYPPGPTMVPLDMAFPEYLEGCPERTEYERSRLEV